MTSSNDSQKDPLSNLMEILFTRKLIVTIGFICTFSIILIGVKLMPPLYEAYTSVYISVPTLPKVEVPYTNEIAGRSFLSNQTNVMKSRLILEKVVNELNLDKKTKIEANFITTVKNKIKNLLNISGSYVDPLEEAIENLKSSIYLYVPRGSNIVYIKVLSRTAESAALIANTVATEYIGYANQFLVSKTQSSYDFIEKQVKDANRKLLYSESKLNEFKRKEKIFSIDEESSLIIQKLIELNEQYQELNIQINDAEQYKDNLAELKTYRDEMNAKSMAETEIKKLINQLETLKNELSVSLVTLKESHPDIKILRTRIEQLESRLKDEKSKTSDSMESGNYMNSDSSTTNEAVNYREIDKLKFRKNYLINQIRIYEKRLEKLTDKQTTYEKLLRTLERDQNTLITLKGKLEAAKILQAKDTNQGGIRVIDRAYPPLYPLKRKKIMFLMIGFVAAIIVSIGTALIAEYIDESLKTPEEAEKYLNLPILGTIPKEKKSFESFKKVFSVTH